MKAPMAADWAPIRRRGGIPRKRHGWRTCLVFSLFLSGIAFAGPVEELLGKAKSLYEKGKFLESAEVYKEILVAQKEILRTNNQLSAEIWQGFGEALLRAGRKAEAEKAFNRVAAHKGRRVDLSTPQSPDAPGKPPVPVIPASDIEELKSGKTAEAKELYKNAMAYISGGGSRIMAILSLMEACRKEPDNTELLFKTAHMIIENSETYYKTAREMMTHLNELKKGKLADDEKVDYARILYLVEPYKHAEAEGFLNEVLAADPKNTNALNASAELNLYKGKFDKAMEGFKKLAEVDSKDLRALWGMGYSHRGLGKDQEALLAFRDAYDKSPSDAPANVKMGQAMLKMGKENFAVKYFYQALDIDPEYIDANLGLLPVLLKGSEDMTAREYLDKVAEIDPGNPKLFLYKGIFDEMRGGIGRAVNGYELSAAYGPEAVDAKLRLARIYMGIGHSFPGKSFSNEDPMVRKEYNLYRNPKKALKYLKEVIQLAPNHPESGFIAESIEKLENQLNPPQE